MSIIRWKKLYFKTLVLAYFFFNVKKSFDLSEKWSASEWKSKIFTDVNIYVVIIYLVSSLLFSSDMRFNFFKRMS